MIGVNAYATADSLKLVGAGTVLSAGHTGGEVIGYDDCDGRVLIDCIKQAGHTGVGECAVTYDGNCGEHACIGGTLGHGDAGTHINGTVKSLERRQGAKCIATYVTEYL